MEGTRQFPPVLHTEMFLYLSILATGCLCQSSPDTPTVVVMENDTATLSCPHAVGHDVRWSRFRNHGKEELLTIKDGQKTRHAERFDSLPDMKSLIITKVKESDTTFYLCNEKPTVYLNVARLPVATTPSARILLDTPRDDAPRDGAPRDDAPSDDAPSDDAPSYADHWKVYVGIVIGGALVLLAILTLRFCSKKRAVNNTNVDKTMAEAIYEEIEDCEIQPSRKFHLESPYYWTTVSEVPSTSPPANDKLYSTVNKLQTKGRRNEECVYSLAQNPQTPANVT